MNLSRWFEGFAPLVFAVALAGVVGVLVARGAGRPLAYPLGGCALAGAGAAVFVWRRVRSSFESTADALARLDLSLGLHSRLCSASSGVGAWPAVTPEFPVRWRRSRGVNLCLAAAVLLLAAVFAPVGDALGGVFAPRPEPPAALRELRAAAKRLAEEKAVEPKALEELEKRAEALLKQPESSWYQSSMLEAAEHLKERMGESLRDLDKDLAALGTSTDRLAESGDFRTESLPPELAKALSDALEGLDLSALPPPAALREKLKDLKPGSLKALDAKQLDELRRALADARRRLRRSAAGEAQAKAGQCAAMANGLPIFLFAPGATTGADALMKLAVGSADAAAVDSGLQAADAAEMRKIEDELAKEKPRIHLQSGCKPGMTVSGVLIVPGTTDPADETLAEALEDLVYGDALAVRESTQARTALVAALKAGRLRTVPFNLTACNGNCPGGTCKKTGLSLTLALGGTGTGGPGGGGGAAPMTLGDKTGATANKTESLSASDLSRAALGDLQGVSTGKHKVDREAWRGPVTGGAIATEGDGSEAVWTDNLTPEERETLSRYFK